MNSKRVNWLFLSMVMAELVLLAALMLFGRYLSIGIVTNIIISEMILVVPTLLFLAVFKEERKELFIFRKLKFTTIVMIIVLTYLITPLVTMVNAITMFFSDNVVTQISDEVTNLPFILSFFMMAIFGPFCEEMVFRGAVQGGCRKSGTPLGAILFSALLFGLIHMNFNQAPYALIIGIVLAVLKEITGSIWAPFLCHLVFNGNTTIMLYASKKMLPEMPEVTVPDKELMLIICVYAVVAVVTTALAACTLIWIGKNEGGESRMQMIFNKNKEKKERMVTVPGVLGVILCLLLMIML